MLQLLERVSSPIAVAKILQFSAGSMARLIFAIAALLLSASSYGHHPGAESLIGLPSLQSLAGVEITAAGFDLGSEQGNYVTAELVGSAVIWDAAVITARFPYEWIGLNGAANRRGAGDTLLSIRSQLLGVSERFSFSPGIGVELPTGDEHAGLGSGHFELIPLLSVLYGGDGGPSWYGTFRGLFSLEGDDGHHHEEELLNFTDPHTDRELQYSVGALFPVVPDLFADLSLGGVVPLTEAERFDSATYFLGPSLGWVADRRWRVIAGARLPFGPDRRFEWSTSGRVDLLF